MATLDGGDNDPVVLWSYVIQALRGVCPAIGQSASPRAAGSAHIVDIVLPHLVNELNDQHGVTLILDDFHRLSAGAAGDGKLTERERRVLRLLASDLSERDIGQELYVSHNTVHSHVRSIYRKLGVSSRAHALQRTRELRLL